MKAIRAHQWCEPKDLRIDEVERPKPQAGQVLVKVRAAALNFPDILLIAGKYQVKPPLPFTPGLEVAGTIEEMGAGVSEFTPGQRVMALVDMGGFAEFALASTMAVQPLPEAMTDEEGAAFALVYQTSYFGIVHRGQLRPGETVLVHSAAGGVGLAAVQIARALGAGKIIGTAGSDEKLKLIREQGADVALNYQAGDFVEVVKRETEGRGANLIFDPVGGEIGERDTKCIAFGGRIVLVGFTSGKFSNFVSNHILLKNYSVVGLHWGIYRQQDAARVEQTWKALFDLHRAGKLKPVIGGRFPMERVADAMEFLASRKATGKIVLHLDSFAEAKTDSSKQSGEIASKTNAEKALEFFKAAQGKEMGVGEWLEMTQERINQFADATLDHQFIHVDPEKAARLSPYKVPIAHGFLTLSLIPHLNKTIPPPHPEACEGLQMGINYGLEKARFPSPVKVGSKVRARMELLSAELKAPNTIQLKHKVTVEIQGGGKPACVAEILSRLVY